MQTADTFHKLVSKFHNEHLHLHLLNLYLYNREYHEDNNGGINYTYNYEILVRYNEGVNIASLIESNDNYINNFNDDIMSFLGEFYKYDTLDDDYFMMYNYDNNTYNTLYNEPNYQYLIFSYNIESNYLYVIDINSK